MNIFFSDSIGNTPAMVDRETGDIYLNSNTWNELQSPYQAFILEHEKGHYVLQTTNELEADHYAFEHTVGTFTESLKNSVRVLYDVLPYTSEMHSLRLMNIYRLALCWDYDHDPTPERLAEIRNIEDEILTYFADNIEFMDYILSHQERGTIRDYEFPGYDPTQFQPSVGRWFRDFPNAPQQTGSTPWPNAQNSASGTGTTETTATQAATAANAENEAGSVSLDLVPDYSLNVTIDLKTVIIVFLIGIAVSILNRL